MAERASGYTSRRLGVADRLSELTRLVKAHRHPDHDVEAVASTLERAEDRIRAELGAPLEQLTIIDVGSGQRRTGAAVFAQRNTALAIDAEVIHGHLTPTAIWSVTRHEGPVRAAKTVARKLLGFDAMFESRLRQRLAIEDLGDPRGVCMDAMNLGLRDNSVDVCFSRCLFEHLPRPARATSELARVLRPGGVLYVVANPFSGPLGAHDPDIMSQTTPIDWAHLQEEPTRKSASNAYLNEWTIGQYTNMFSEQLPGSAIELWWPPDTELEDRISTLRRSGALASFSDEELLAREVIAVWRKDEPAPSSSEGCS